MSSSRNTDESFIIHDITSNPQNTHNSVVSNSVGMAVLQLKRNYWPESPSEEFLQQEYKTCVDQLRDAITETNRAAIERMIEQAEQSIVPAHDILTLYLPIESTTLSLTTEVEYQEIKFLMPLKQVLPLVWRAIHDHNKYVQNYSGTETEKHAKAVNDLKYRLETFFNSLAELYTDEICHHGNRNENIFVLNRSYAGIDIIEDSRTTILTILKDKINELFWKEFKNAENTKTQKDNLVRALMKWITDSDPAEIVELVDPGDHIHRFCHDLILRHGSDPVQVGLDELINAALPKLQFSCNPKEYPVLAFVNKIISLPLDNRYPVRNAALHKFHDILRNLTDIDSTKTQALVSNFFLCITADIDLCNHEYLLKITGLFTDSFAELAKECETVFLAIAKGNFINLTLPTIEQISNLHKAIKASSKDNLADEIINFFAKWVFAVKAYGEADNSEEHIYSLFLNPHFRAKAELTDAQLAEMPQQEQHVDDTAQGFRTITLYQINRIILHAMYNVPSTWSVAFKKIFIQILQFLKNDFNDAQSDLLRNQKKTSYEYFIIEQLEYLKSVAEDPDGDYSAMRSPIFLLMPTDIRHINEWARLAERTNRDSQEFCEAYELQAVKINSWIIKSYEDSFFRYIHSLPPGYRLKFVTTNFAPEQIQPLFTNNAASLFVGNLFANFKELVAFLEFISCDKVIKITRDYIAEILEKIKIDDRLLFLTSLKDTFGRDIINDESYEYMRLLTYEQGCNLIDNVFEFKSYEAFGLNSLVYTIVCISPIQHYYSYLNKFIEMSDVSKHFTQCLDLVFLLYIPEDKRRYIIDELLTHDYFKVLLNSRKPNLVGRAQRESIFTLMSIDFWKDLLQTDFYHAARFCPVSMVIEYCDHADYPERMDFDRIGNAYGNEFRTFIDEFPLDRLRNIISQNPYYFMAILRCYTPGQSSDIMITRIGKQLICDAFSHIDIVNYELIKRLRQILYIAPEDIDESQSQTILAAMLITEISKSALLTADVIYRAIVEIKKRNDPQLDLKNLNIEYLVNALSKKILLKIMLANVATFVEIMKLYGEFSWGKFILLLDVSDLNTIKEAIERESYTPITTNFLVLLCFRITSTLLEKSCQDTEAMVKTIIEVTHSMPRTYYRSRLQLLPEFKTRLNELDFVVSILEQLNDDRLSVFTQIFDIDYEIIFNNSSQLLDLFSCISGKKAGQLIEILSTRFICSLITNTDELVTFIHEMTKYSLIKYLDLAFVSKTRELITSAAQMQLLLNDNLDSEPQNDCIASYDVLIKCFHPAETKQILGENLQTVYHDLPEAMKPYFSAYLCAGQMIAKNTLITIAAPFLGCASKFFHSHLPEIYKEAMQSDTDVKRYAIIQKYIRNPDNAEQPFFRALINTFRKSFFNSLPDSVEISPQVSGHKIKL